MDRVAGLYDPGGPPHWATGPATFTSRVVHLQKRSAPQFQIFSLKMMRLRIRSAIKFNIFSSKMVHFQRWNAPQFHIFSSKIFIFINCHRRSALQCSFIFIERGLFSEEECAPASRIFVKLVNFQRRSDSHVDERTYF